MQGHPQIQRPILLNCQWDGARIKEQKKAKAAPGFRAYNQELFPDTILNYDHNINAGDFLIMLKNEDYCDNVEQINEQGQQPWVMASLNGMPCTKLEYENAKGFTEHEKIRNVFMSKAAVIGISLKSHVFDGEDRQQIDDPVAVVAGAHEMENRGPYDIRPLEWVGWDVPKPGDYSPTMSEGNGTTKTQCKLVPVPMREMITVNASQVTDFLIKHCGVNKQKQNAFMAAVEKPNTLDLQKFLETFVAQLVSPKGNCNQRDTFITYGESCFEICKSLCEDVFMIKGVRVPESPKLKFGKQGDRTLSQVAFMYHLALQLTDNPDAQKKFDRHLGTMREQQMELRERLQGKCMRGAKVGERLDILLG